MLLHFIFILAFSAFSVPAASIIGKRDISQGFINEGIKMINTARAAFAQRHQIGNMYEMVYDSDLEKKAKDMTDCRIKSGDYYLFLQNDGNNEETKKMIFHPLQTKIACASFIFSCPNRDIKKNTEFCLIGPRSKFYASDVRRGPLGSHCEQGLTQEGLCESPKDNSSPSGIWKAINDIVQTEI